MPGAAILFFFLMELPFLIYKRLLQTNTKINPAVERKIKVYNLRKETQMVKAHGAPVTKKLQMKLNWIRVKQA